MKKITVVTVVYNALSLLKVTLESSSLPSDVEYLVVDGNSSDGTQKYLEGFALSKKFDDFSYISEPDKGVYDAMNKAADLAKGEYIVFMNAGDLFYDENTLSNAIAHIEAEDKPDVVYGGHLLFDESKSVYCRTKPLKHLWKRMVFCHQAMYVKTELQKQYYFDYRNFSADHTFIYTLFSRGYRFSCIEKPLARYLDGGLSVKHYRKSIKHRFQGVMGQTKGYFRKFKIVVYYLLVWFAEPEKYKLSKLIKK
jgi:glycosyltransferase involved in cell wall biosynthesis